MKTRAIANTVLSLGVVATLLLVWTAVNGFSVAGEAGLRSHLLLALLAVFLLTLAHGWVVLFLLASRWAINSTFVGLSGRVLDQARSIRRSVVPFALLALVLAILDFALGGRTFTGGLSAGTHQAFSWLTVAAQVAALAVERSGLNRYSELLSTLEREAHRGQDGVGEKAVP